MNYSKIIKSMSYDSASEGAVVPYGITIAAKDWRRGVGLVRISRRTSWLSHPRACREMIDACH